MHELNRKLIELLPELKELVPGCEVMQFGKKVILNKTYVKVQDDLYESVNEKGNPVIARFDDILGKEPTLSDVLRAIGERKDIVITNKGSTLVFRLTIGEWSPEQIKRFAIWDLTKDLNDQPEDTKQFILSILNK